MRARAVLCWFLCLVGLVPRLSLAAPPGAELLVGFHPHVDAVQSRTILAQAGARPLRHLPKLKVHVIRAGSPQAREAVTRALLRRPEVAFVEPQGYASPEYVPNDPKYAQAWHLPRIAAPTGWDVTQGSATEPIAMLDSGIDATHPDLRGKIMPGYSFLTRTTDTRDVHGHGTAVAGVAGALTGNGIGVAGTAPRTPLMPLVVLSAQSWATYSDMASAFVYAADHGVKVVSISLIGNTPSQTLQAGVQYAWQRGTLIVAAAGNNGTSALRYPASLTHVLAVAATGPQDTRLSFSNYGPWIDLAAPGSTILTTSRGGGYGAWTGTSMAAPIVAGVAALVRAVRPTLTPQQVVDLLQRTSMDLGTPGYDPYYGHGRVDLARAVQAARDLP